MTNGVKKMIGFLSLWFLGYACAQTTSEPTAFGIGVREGNFMVARGVKPGPAGTVLKSHDGCKSGMAWVRS